MDKGIEVLVNKSEMGSRLGIGTIFGGPAGSLRFRRVISMRDNLLTFVDNNSLIQHQITLLNQPISLCYIIPLK